MLNEKLQLVTTSGIHAWRHRADTAGSRYNHNRVAAATLARARRICAACISLRFLAVHSLSLTFRSHLKAALERASTLKKATVRPMMRAALVP